LFAAVALVGLAFWFFKKRGGRFKDFGCLSGTGATYDSHPLFARMVFTNTLYDSADVESVESADSSSSRKSGIEAEATRWKQSRQDHPPSPPARYVAGPSVQSVQPFRGLQKVESRKVVGGREPFFTPYQTDLPSPTLTVASATGMSDLPSPTDLMATSKVGLATNSPSWNENGSLSDAILTMLAEPTERDVAFQHGLDETLSQVVSETGSEKSNAVSASSAVESGTGTSEQSFAHAMRSWLSGMHYTEQLGPAAGTAVINPVYSPRASDLQTVSSSTASGLQESAPEQLPALTLPHHLMQRSPAPTASRPPLIIPGCSQAQGMPQHQHLSQTAEGPLMLGDDEYGDHTDAGHAGTDLSESGSGTSSSSYKERL